MKKIKNLYEKKIGRLIISIPSYRFLGWKID